VSGLKGSDTKDILDIQINAHEMWGDDCVMLLCEIKFPVIGLLGDNSPYGIAKLQCYVIQYNIEKKHRSRVCRSNLKDMRMMHFVDQKSQLFVWGMLSKSLKANDWKVRDDVREMVLEMLELVGNRFSTV